jgi:Family of unknown function (DUF6709)
MDTWVHQQLRAMYRRRVIAWCVVLGGAVLFALAQSRYISNFIRGPFDLAQPELDAIGDPATAPRYFVRVTGSKAIETGIQQFKTRKRGGVETSRSVSAAYYVLVVGDRLLVVQRAEGTPTTVQGELTAMPAELQRHLFNTPQMEAIRGRFYPYYLDDSSFRMPGYIGVVVALILAVLLVKYGLPAWRYARDVSSHPVVRRVAAWGDPVGIAVEARREAASPRYKGGGWRVTDKYVIRSAPFAFDLLRLSDLLWAYKRVTKHSVNFIPTGKSYSGVLVCYGGAAEVTGRETNVDALLTFAGERAPWAIFGYSDDLNKLFKQKTQDFCAAVEQRKREPARQVHT